MMADGAARLFLFDCYIYLDRQSENWARKAVAAGVCFREWGFPFADLAEMYADRAVVAEGRALLALDALANPAEPIQVVHHGG